MKVAICWSHISGYMAACWRALAARPGIELSIIAESSASPVSQIAFPESMLAGLDHQMLPQSDIRNTAILKERLLQLHPDIIVLCGWANPAFRAIARDPAFASCRFVMTMDTPRKYSLRQFIGRLTLRPFLRRMDRIVVAGERAWQYARFLGFAEEQIIRGVYGYDESLFNRSILDQRSTTAADWPRSFLYMGRYAAEKGLDTLVNAHNLYRETTNNPWPLTCCGKGPLASLFTGKPLITDRGFVQPHDQPAVYREHGVLILPSRYEPWGVVVAEAMATGMPVICSESCGAAVELLRPYYTGLLFPADNSVMLAKAMSWVTLNHDQLLSMGVHAAEYAPAFSSKLWAIRWQQTLASL